MGLALENFLVNHDAELGPDLEEVAAPVFVLELHAHDFNLDGAKFILFRVTHALLQLIKFGDRNLMADVR
jgi:hypothetical protein